MNWPGKLFWVWSLRSVLHSLIVGAVLGVIWMVLAETVTSEPVIQTRAGFILSFIVDTSFIYAVCVIGALSGLALQTWGVVGWVISEGKTRLLQGWLVAIFFNLLIGVGSRYLQVHQGFVYDSLAVMGMSFIVAGMMAWSSAFNAYCVNATMSPTERRVYRGSVRDMTWGDRMKRFVPLIDRNKSILGTVVGGFLLSVAFSVSYYINYLTGGQHLVPIYLSAMLGIMFCLMGFLYRLCDTLRPGKHRDRLYPYFEDYR